MAHPFFSIIIPCLNEEKVLPRLLKQLQKQTYHDFEVFVVDGNSTDGTQQYVEKLSAQDPRFHLLTSRKRNVSIQRNLGAKKSKGDYLLFFDADTQIAEYFLAGIHFKCLHEQIDAFTTYAEADTTNAKDLLFMRMSNMLFEAASKVGMPLTYGACMGAKRSLFWKVGGFDEEMTFMEDTELAKRIVANGHTFSLLKEPTYVYSLRRFRKEGNVLLYRNIGNNLKVLFLDKKITEPLESYPMFGGSYFSKAKPKKKKTKTFQRLQKLVESVQTVLREQNN